MPEFAYLPNAMRMVQAENRARGTAAIRDGKFSFIPTWEPESTPPRWGKGPQGEFGAWLIFSQASKAALNQLIARIECRADCLKLHKAMEAYPAHITIQPAFMPEGVSDAELEKRVRAAELDERVRRWRSWYSENPLPITFDTLIAGAAEIALYATMVFPVVRESREELAEAFRSHGLKSEAKTDIVHTTVVRFQDIHPLDTGALPSLTATFEHDMFQLSLALKEEPLTLMTRGLWVGKGIMFENSDL